MLLATAAAVGAGLVIYNQLKQVDEEGDQETPAASPSTLGPPSPLPRRLKYSPAPFSRPFLPRSTMSTPVEAPRYQTCLSCGDLVTVVPNPREAKRTSGYFFRTFGVKLSCPGDHTYCVACMSSFVGIKLEMSLSAIKVFPMKCPGCPGRPWSIPDEVAESVLEKRAWQQWQQVKYLESIETMYCPNVRCSELLGVDEGAVVDGKAACTEGSPCPKCKQKICIPCKTLAHPGMTCVEFAKSPKRDDAGLRRLASKKHWRRCPKCQVVVERSEGCNHMTCRCGHHFCYQCGCEWLSGCSNPGKCKRWQADASLYTPGRLKLFVQSAAKVTKGLPATTRRRLSSIMKRNDATTPAVAAAA